MCRSGECVTAAGTNKKRWSADTSLWIISLQESTTHSQSHTYAPAAAVKSVMGTHSATSWREKAAHKSSHNILKENARLPSRATCSLIDLACSMQSAHTSTIHHSNKKRNTQTSSWIKTHIYAYLLPGLWRRPEIDQGSCFDGGAALNVLNLITGCGCNYLYRYSIARMGVQPKGCWLYGGNKKNKWFKSIANSFEKILSGCILLFIKEGVKVYTIYESFDFVCVDKNLLNLP